MAYPDLKEAVNDAWMVLGFRSEFAPGVLMSTNPWDEERYPTFSNLLFYVPHLKPGEGLQFNFDPNCYEISYKKIPAPTS